MKANVAGLLPLRPPSCPSLAMRSRAISARVPDHALAGPPHWPYRISENPAAPPTQRWLQAEQQQCNLLQQQEIAHASTTRGTTHTQASNPQPPTLNHSPPNTLHRVSLLVVNVISSVVRLHVPLGTTTPT